MEIIIHKSDFIPFSVNITSEEEKAALLEILGSYLEFKESSHSYSYSTDLAKEIMHEIFSVA